MLLSFTANLGLNPTKSDLCTSKSFKGKINNILLTVMFIGIKIKHNKLFFLKLPWRKQENIIEEKCSNYLRV